MTLYLVRHAHAGERRSWDEPDWLRPLSARGQVQARQLPGLLHTARFGHIVSSPYVRCMETMVPLAGHHLLPIVPEEALAEGATIDATLALVRRLAPEGAVLCSHGDVLPLLLEHFQRLGLDLGADPRCQKGSTWIVETDDGTAATTARYLPPPDA